METARTVGLYFAFLRFVIIIGAYLSYACELLCGERLITNTVIHYFISYNMIHGLSLPGCSCQLRGAYSVIVTNCGPNDRGLILRKGRDFSLRYSSVCSPTGTGAQRYHSLVYSNQVRDAWH
jgi:hypothetical protein